MAVFVLVHGAWGGGWAYREISERLRAEGHEVHVADLTGLGERAHLLSPGISLSTHIEDVAAIIEGRDLHDIILAGHSYGGMVITGVAARLAERIASLVYIDAFLPRDGEAIWDLATDWERKHYIDAQRDAPGLVAPFPGSPPGLTRHPLLTLLEPVRLSGNEHRIGRRTYVYATASPLTVFGQFYERVKGDSAWRVHIIATGHAVMQDDPDGLLKILLDEVRT